MARSVAANTSAWRHSGHRRICCRFAPAANDL